MTPGSSKRCLHRSSSAPHTSSAGHQHGNAAIAALAGVVIAIFLLLAGTTAFFFIRAKEQEAVAMRQAAIEARMAAEFERRMAAEQSANAVRLAEPSEAKAELGTEVPVAKGSDKKDPDSVDLDTTDPDSSGPETIAPEFRVPVEQLAAKDIEIREARAALSKAEALAIEATSTRDAAVRRAEGLRLVARSALSLDREPGRALLLAIEGAERAPGLDANLGLLAALDRIRELRTVRGRTGASASVLNRDGDRIATLMGAAVLWDAETGEQIAQLGPQFHSIVFGPMGERVLTSGSRVEACLWDADSGELLHRLNGCVGRVQSGSFRPDGRWIVLPAGNHSAHIFDVRTGQLVRSLDGHTGLVHTALFALQGQQVVTIAEDQTVRIWNSATGKHLRTLDWLVGRHRAASRTVGGDPIPSKVTHAQVSPDGRWFLAITDHMSLRVFDLLKGEHPNDALSAREAYFRPDGLRLLKFQSGDQWPYVDVLDTRTGRLVHRLAGHTKGIRAAAFGPSGSRIATASYDKTVRIWDADTGDELVVLRGHASQVQCVGFSADGEKVVSGDGSGAVRLWHVEDGARRAAIPVPKESSPVVAVAPMGDRLLALRPTDLVSYVWDVEGRKRAASLSGRSMQGMFSPDGRFVLTRRGRIHDAASGRIVHRLDSEHSDRVVASRYGPKGDRVVTCSTDKTAILWNASRGAKEFVLDHEGVVWDAAFSPDGRFLATASADRRVRVWDAATGEITATLRGHTDGVRAVAFAPDGERIISTGRDGTARIWKRTGESTGVLTDPIGIGHASIDASGRFALTFKSFTNPVARVWDLASGEQLWSVGDATARTRTALFTPGGKHVLLSMSDGSMRLADSATGAPVYSVPISGRGGVRLSSDLVTIAPDGEKVLLRIGTKAMLFQLGDGSPLGEVIADEGAILSLNFDPSGRRLHVGLRLEGANIWDWRTGRLAAELQGGHGGQFRGAEFSPDGRHAVTVAGGTARTWDVKTGDPLAMLRGHDKAVLAAAFAPDGRVVTASADQTVRIWKVTGEQVNVLEGHGDAVVRAVPSADGNRLATICRDNTLRLFDLGSGEELRELDVQDGAIRTVQFNSNGDRLLAASTLDTSPRALPGRRAALPRPAEVVYSVRVWNVETGTRAFDVPHPAGVAGAAFNADGSRIGTVCQNVIRILDASSGEELARRETSLRFLSTVEFDRTGRFLLVVGRGQTARLHDAKTLEPLAEYTMENGIHEAHFVPDGSTVLTVAREGAIRRWPTDPLAAARQRKPRELTAAERSTYGLR